MDASSQVAKNTSVQILGRVVVVIATVITTAILTRFLGASGYGNYIFITSFVALFTAISDWGTGIISIREAAKESKGGEKVFGNALVLRFIFALASFLAVNLLARILPQFQDLILVATIASVLLFLHSFRTSFHIVFQAKLRFENQALAEVLISTTFLLFLFLPLSIGLNLPWVMLFLVIANLLGTALALILARRLTRFDLGLEKPILRKILSASIPTGALLLIFSIYNRIDIFILQAIKGSVSVGIYGLAYKIHDNLILGAAFLMAALFPLLSRYAADLNSKTKLAVIYQKTFDVLFLLGGGMVFIFFIFAPLIIKAVGGEEFFESILVLRILVFATLLAYFNHLTGYTLIALGKQRASLTVAVVALIWNVGLNLVFIPRYSSLAAAGVTVATEGLVLFLTSFYLAKTFNLKPSLTFPKTLVEIIKTRGKIF